MQEMDLFSQGVSLCGFAYCLRHQPLSDSQVHREPGAGVDSGLWLVLGISDGRRVCCGWPELYN